MSVARYTYDTLPRAERALVPADTDVINAVEQPIQVGSRQLDFDECIAEQWQPSSTLKAGGDVDGR